MSDTMRVDDAPSAKLAEFYCTINGQRRNMLSAKKFEAKAAPTLSDVKALGMVITGKKATGLEIKISCTVYKCSDMFDDIITSYKDTGIMPRFEVQVTSEDNATNIGSDTKVYTDCIISGDVLLSMFDADGDFIEQEIEAYAMDYEHKDKYTDPDYMGA